MKGDPRKKTERARKIRLWASRIPDVPALVDIARQAPEGQRASFLEGIAPFLKFKLSGPMDRGPAGASSQSPVDAP